MKGNKPPKTTKEASLQYLLCMHKSSRTCPKKLEIINHTIHNHLELLYVWGCEALDGANGQEMKVPLKHLNCTWVTWVHMQVTEGQSAQLTDEVVMFHGSRARIFVFVMRVM